MKKMNLKKTISMVLVLLFVVSIINGSTIGWEDSSYDSPLDESVVNDDETVWWNTTEFSTESYTAPFFEVYKLKHLGQAAYGLDVADFNNDGLPDIVVNWMTAPWDGLAGISIFYSNNDNSYKIEDIAFFDLPTEDLDAADFDNDGDIDIMYSIVLDGQNDEYSIKMLWNENDEFILGDEIAHFSREDGYWINPHITTADFDRDGDVDFIVGANCGKVKLFKNDGTGNFTDEGVIFDYGDVSWGLATGDFNDDGYPDFIVSARTNPDEYPFQDAGHIYLKLNDKSKDCFDNESPGIKIGGLPFPGDYTIGLQVSGSVEVLDYNDDGLLDVVYGGDYKIYLLIQQSDGSFKPFYAVGLRDREYTWTDYLKEGGFTIADINQDGLDDVVAGGVQGDVRLLINNQTFVKIVEPKDRLLYFFGNDDYQLKFPGQKVVVGDIEVIASAVEPLSRVDFYVDGILVKSDDSEPFSWNWTRFGFREYKVIAEAYDSDGHFAGKDMFMIWKFL